MKHYKLPITINNNVYTLLYNLTLNKQYLIFDNHYVIITVNIYSIV